MKKTVLLFLSIIVLICSVFVACNQSNKNNGTDKEKENESVSASIEAEENGENEVIFQDSEEIPEEPGTKSGVIKNDNITKIETTTSTTIKDYIIYKDGTTAVVHTVIYITDTTTTTKPTTTKKGEIITTTKKDEPKTGEPIWDD